MLLLIIFMLLEHKAGSAKQVNLESKIAKMETLLSNVTDTRV